MATKVTGKNNIADPIAARNAALAQSANATRKPPVARVPELPTLASDPMAEQLAAMQAQMAQFAALLAQKDQQIAELKSAKPAKAEKPAPTPENMGISIKGNILTIVVDLSKDSGHDTSNGANRVVASQNSAVGPYKFTYAGREHWLSCCVAFPHENAAELRKAYREAKKAR